jgi:hypothetical protein
MDQTTSSLLESFKKMQAKAQVTGFNLVPAQMGEYIADLARQTGVSGEAIRLFYGRFIIPEALRACGFPAECPPEPTVADIRIADKLWEIIR